MTGIENQESERRVKISIPWDLGLTRSQRVFWKWLGFLVYKALYILEWKWNERFLWSTFFFSLFFFPFCNVVWKFRLWALNESPTFLTTTRFVTFLCIFSVLYTMDRQNFEDLGIYQKCAFSFSESWPLLLTALIFQLFCPFRFIIILTAVIQS